MGFGDFVDGVGDAFEDGIDSVKSTVGSAVDGGAHLLGDGLDAVGLHGAAHAVDSFGDSVADSLGAQVGEYQLGESDDPKDLVHGDVEGIGESVKHLRRFQAAFEQTGQGLSRLDAEHWKGAAGDAFRAKFAPQPKLWLTAADACRAAAYAMDGFAHTVTWAQEQAQQAIDTYKAAKKASEQARDSYDKNVDRYNQAAQDWNKASQDGRDPGPRPTDPGEFHDPGVAGLKQAQEKLRTARQQRDAAADTARSAVDAATATAPAEPSFRSRMGNDLSDTFQGAMVGQLHLAGGLVKGAADIVKFGRGLNPTDPYNLTHPAQYADHVSTTAAGLLHASNHPMELLSAVVGSGWSSDPFEAFGKLTTNVAFGVATGGAGEAGAVAEDVALNTSKNVAENAAKDAGENATKNAAKDAGENAARKDAGQAARDAAENAGKEAREPANIKECGDPVDVATGRVILRQSDLALQGSLPVSFGRAYNSGYRSGLWMGPRWACGADERLVVDSAGVLLLRADGGLLSYPHPVPGVAVLPVSGARWPLTLDPSGTYSVEDPLTGRSRVFTPDPDDASHAPLTELRDRNGRWTAFDYDAAGAPVAIRHHSGHRVGIEVTGDRITALHLTGAGPDGGDLEIVRYGYTDGMLTHVVNSSGLPQVFEYDDRGRMTAWVDRNGSRYGYAYDHLDRCTDQGGTAGHLHYRYAYGEIDPASGHSVTTATDSLGHATRFLVNDRGQVLQETDPLGHVAQWRRDRHDRVLSRTDALGRITAYEYDPAGNLVTVTRPDGAQALAAYDAELNVPLVLVDPDGATWRHRYDRRGNRIATTDPAGRTTRLRHDELGHVVAVTDPLGNTTTLRRDAAGLLLEVRDPLGGTLRYERDAFGRPVASTDPVGGTTVYSWTLEGRLAGRTTPGGARESWRYDGEGNLVEHVDAVGGVSRYEYTHFDLLAARTGPDGVRHEFVHDTELRLLRVTNPQGLTWDYSYDPAGRLVAESDFDDRVLGYDRDAVGRVLARRTGGAEAVRYEHDVLGRLVRKTVDGATTTYTRDRAGRLLRAVCPDVELVREYDQLGRITAEVCNGARLESHYDEAGRRTGRRTPAGVESLWGYDAAGRRTSLSASGHTVGFTYDEAGRETSRSLAGRASLASLWDQDHRLSSQAILVDDAPDPLSEPATAAGGRVVQSRDYTYRPDGMLTEVDDRLSGRRSFALDGNGRISAVSAHNWTERYAYDATGGVTEAHWPESANTAAAVGPREYAGTRVTRAGGVRYEYDAQGRMTLRQKTRLSRKPETWRFAWDAENRLTALTTPDGTDWRYLYDPLGRRIAKQRLEGEDGRVAEQTDFTWDGFTLAEQRTRHPHSAGLHTLTWQHRGARPVCQIEQITRDADPAEVDRRFFAIVTDLIGTPTELVDGSGAIAWRARTTVWGSTTWPKSSTTYTPLRFPGQYFDPESRLHYNVNRYYDPEVGRYASPDPLGLTPAPDHYAYVPNPTVWSDPLGLAPCRAAAKEQALRDAGVPEGSEPLEERWVPSTTPRGKQILDENHQPVYFKEEDYLTDSGDLVTFQDHHTGHSYGDPNGVGDQPPHVHVRPYDDPRNGQLGPPVEEHYYYDPALG
ncbi:putative T7SS-secreted protein [Kitasatospora sp. NPDC057015]|uniref:putative T7SS-secreted protein n=1 Tax=Kitasatospora sp. NPDC057015 TaxID=3346001 RepID=UPI003637E17A